MKKQEKKKTNQVYIVDNSKKNKYTLTQTLIDTAL